MTNFKQIINYRFGIIVLITLLFLSFSLTSNSPTTKFGINNKSYAVVTLANDCSRCMEHSFENLPGVHDVIVGHANGQMEKFNSHEVSSDKNSQIDAIQIAYNPNVISFERLLDVYWEQIDTPITTSLISNRDEQNRSIIFYHNAEQKQIAETSRQKYGRNEQNIIPIKPAVEFFVAQDHYQNYASDNQSRFNLYRPRSDQDHLINKKWTNESGFAFVKTSEKNMNKSTYIKPSDDELRQKLTPLQYEVTQEDGTERPYKNEYWDNHAEGIYVDIVSGEPLFSSTDKFDSGTGWPSFTKPIDGSNIVEKTDRKFFMTRTEVRSPIGDSHLGHLFNDGPAPTGKRYCINSASLKFVPKSDLTKKGYENLVKLFK